MWFWSFADEGRPEPGAEPRPGADGRRPPGAAPPNRRKRTVASEVNDTVLLMLPWLASFLFHLGVIVLAFFLVWALIQEDEEEPIIPIARLSEEPGGSLSRSADMELQQTQDRREVETEEVAIEDSVSELDMSTDNRLELVGLSGGSDGGKLAPFGATDGGGDGVGAKLYGLGGNATRIIYLIDASGSLIDTLPFVINELKRSLNELSDRQEFTVIFFQGGDAVEVPPGGWRRATSENKRAVAEWITLEEGNVVPRGATDPIPALQLAMNYRPQLVFLLSDNITGRGRFEIDRDELVQMLDRANRDRRVTFNTIQFLYPDPLNTLERIAEEHGGMHKFITESDLGLR